jgi:hypothetical protein
MWVSKLIRRSTSSSLRESSLSNGVARRAVAICARQQRLRVAVLLLQGGGCRILGTRTSGDVGLVVCTPDWQQRRCFRAHGGRQRSVAAAAADDYEDGDVDQEAGVGGGRVPADLRTLSLAEAAELLLQLELQEQRQRSGGGVAANNSSKRKAKAKKAETMVPASRTTRASDTAAVATLHRNWFYSLGDLEGLDAVSVLRAVPGFCFLVTPSPVSLSLSLPPPPPSTHTHTLLSFSGKMGYHKIYFAMYSMYQQGHSYILTHP